MLDFVATYSVETAFGKMEFARGLTGAGKSSKGNGNKMRLNEEILARISTASSPALGIAEWNALAVASYSPTPKVERPNN